MPLSAADRGEIDLAALFREVGRRKWLVLVVTLGALVASVLAVNVLKPRYTGETRVFLENRDTEYTRIGRDPARGTDLPIDQDAVLSQIQIIQSRDIAREMIKRFNLGAKPEFDDVLGGVDALTKVGVLLGIINNPASMSPEERVLEKYFDKLKAFAVAKSRVIAVEFTSKDPELAAQLSDAIAEEYIRQLELAKKGSAKSAGSWLGRTIDTLRERVAAAESKVEAYRNQNGLFLIGRENANISSQQLSELNTQLATARAQQSEFSSRARVIRDAVRQGRIFEVSEVVNNEVVRRLIETRATLKAQIAQEERTLLPQHPRVKELYAQLGGLEDQIRSAAERTAKTFENDARTAGARVAASQAELDQQKRLSGTSNEQEVQLRALEREAKAEREQLETYLGRYRDASVRDSDNAVTADARVVSRAIVPSNPSFPKKLPIIIIATLAGFAISLFWILTQALLSDRIYTRRVVEAPVQPQFPPMIHPQVLAAMAAQGMAYQQAMSQPPQTVQPATQEATPPTPAQTAEPEQTPSPAALSEASQAMRESLARMTVALRKASPEAGTTPVSPTLQQQGGQPVSETAAPPLVPRTADLTGPMHGDPEQPAPPRSLQGLAWKASDDQTLPADDPLTETTVDNPLFDVADEAEEALIRGRPVSILVLSVEQGVNTETMVNALESILRHRAPTMVAVIDAGQITSVGLAEATRSLSGNRDYVVYNGGSVGPSSTALSLATTMTVLVAADDTDESKVAEAELVLSGCNYFIVDAASALELQNA